MGSVKASGERDIGISRSIRIPKNSNRKSREPDSLVETLIDVNHAGILESLFYKGFNIPLRGTSPESPT